MHQSYHSEVQGQTLGMTCRWRQGTCSPLCKYSQTENPPKLINKLRDFCMQSLCYQLPAIVSEAITLVISPLISLAKDQVDNWNARGSSIDASAYNCTVPSYVKQKVPQPLQLRSMWSRVRPANCSRESLQGEVGADLQRCSLWRAYAAVQYPRGAGQG